MVSCTLMAANSITVIHTVSKRQDEHLSSIQGGTQCADRTNWQPLTLNVLDVVVSQNMGTPT